MAEISQTADDAMGPAPATEETSPRRFRFTMSTLMVFVLTAAVASALFSELGRPFRAKGLNRWAIDIPAIVLLAISLNAVALGCWLRLSVNRVLIQITLCCLLVLGGVWLWEWKFDRGLLYWLQASFAAVVVVPLLVKAAVAGDEGSGPRSRRIGAGVNDLLLAYASFVLLLIVATFQTLVLFTFMAGLR